MSRPEARDPKTAAVTYFLTEHLSEGKNWLEHGCIIFSQYYDTVRALTASLATALPGEAIGIYAGAGRSGIHKDEGVRVSGTRGDQGLPSGSTKSASSWRLMLRAKG